MYADAVNQLIAVLEAVGRHTDADKIRAQFQASQQAGGRDQPEKAGGGRQVLGNSAKQIAALKLQYAEEELKEAEGKQRVGLVTPSEYEKLKLARDIAAEEAKGNGVEAARLMLESAELDLRVVQAQRNAGQASKSEYNRLKLARDIAAAEYAEKQQASETKN
jgi:hypothetical protein